MFDIIEKTEKNILSTKVSGKLSKEDYKQMYPLIEETIDNFGKIKAYIELENFEGWENPEAFLNEIKIDVKYFNDLEKVAIVGEKKWEEIATYAADFLTQAKIKYFNHKQKEEAKNRLYK